MPAVNPPDALGPALHIYRSRGIGRGELLAVVLPGLLLAGGLAAWGVFRAYLAYPRFGPAAALAWSRPWLVAALAILAALLIGLVLRLFNGGHAITLHRGGLRFFRFGRPRRDLYFTEISGICTAIDQDRFLGQVMRTRWKTTLLPAAGPPLALSPALRNLPALVGEIKERIYPRLLPVYQASLQGGQMVRFGPLGLTRQGLQLKHRTWTWDDIRLIDLKNGHLVIELAHGRQAPIQTARIPNLELLLHLVQQGGMP